MTGQEPLTLTLQQWLVISWLSQTALALSARATGRHQSKDALGLTLNSVCRHQSQQAAQGPSDTRGPQLQGHVPRPASVPVQEQEEQAAEGPPVHACLWRLHAHAHDAHDDAHR